MNQKRLNKIIQKIVVFLVIFAMIFSCVPSFSYTAFGETVSKYDVDAAVAYAKEHYDDGGTVSEPDREDCTQFLRECLEAGGVPRDNNRLDENDKPYNYSVPQYMDYLLNNGYAEMYELNLEKQDWSNPQWYVRAEDNKDIFSVGDGVVYYCTECGEYYHMSINTGVNGDGFVLYHAQNSAVGGEPLCLIQCSHCQAPKDKVKLYSLHITSALNGYSDKYDDVAVSNLKARRIDNDRISVTWDPVKGAKGYKVFVKSGKNRAFNLIADTASTSTIYTEKTSGANYYFAVRPYFEDGGKTYVAKLSNEVYNNEYVLPPSNVTAELNSLTGEITVRWNKSPGAKEYEVYRSTSLNGTYTKIYTLEGNGYKEKGQAPETVYYYKVKAISPTNVEGNSELSAAASVKTGSIGKPVVKTSITDSGIRISWDYVTYAKSYEVYRATSENGTYTKMGNAITGNAMNNSAVTAGTVYYYKVKALNDATPNASSTSDAVKQIAKLSAPTVSKVSSSSGKPSVSWNNVKGADKYVVYRANSADCSYAEIKTTTETSYTDTSAVLGKTYYYKVKAVSDLDSAAATDSGYVAITCEAEKASSERVAGNNRYETAVAVANALKSSKGIDKFDNVIVACGDNYADALAGSYLAKVKDAPILLVTTNTVTENYVKDYISKNVNKNGTVYILGGEGVVTKRFADSLSGYTVKRLGGATRFDTNLSILKEAGVKKEDILVCSAWSFADSLSASAVGKPILLVDSKLNSTQKSYLNSLDTANYYLIGGEGAVTKDIYSEVGKYGKVERVSGANRYATAEAIASKFFPDGSSKVVIAYGMEFPDGLTGGPLAMEYSAPLFLVDERNTANANGYVEKYKVGTVTVVGGKGAVSDETLNKVIG